MKNSTLKHIFEFKCELWQWEFFVKGPEHPNSESNNAEILAARIAGLGHERNIDNENVNL
jgi:hypothetical protein